MEFIPKEGVKAVPVPKDECYLLIKYAGAQAYFEGAWYQQAEQVVITSQVDLNSGGVAQLQVPGIEHTDRVDPNKAHYLNLKRNVFMLVPATMDSITFQLDFVVDVTNMVGKMATLVNKGLLSPVLTLVSSAADTAVQKVGQIATELIGAFTGGPNQKRELVHFQGDFNITTQDTKPGYYVLIGNTERDQNLPTAKKTKFAFDGKMLYIDGRPAEKYSWVVLEVQIATARGIRQGSQWAKPLDDMRAKIRNVLEDKRHPERRQQVYDECLKDLESIEVLVQADPFYIESEKELLLKQAYDDLNAIPLDDRSTTRADHLFEAELAKVAASTQRSADFRTMAVPKLTLTGLMEKAPLADWKASLEKYQAKLEESQKVIKEFM